MKLKYCFFDLDGTLIDSSEGIIHSVTYALEKMGLPPLEEGEGYRFIGPPLVQAFCERRALSREESLRAVAYYRENYRAGGILECSVYEGVVELLEALRSRGIVCVLATCKPHEFASRILRYHRLDSYFSFVSGPELDGTRNEKDEVIEYAVEQLGIAEKDAIVMVGDRAGDVLGAERNGVRTVGVLWGFGSREELEAAGAWQVVNKPEEIADFFEEIS